MKKIFIIAVPLLFLSCLAMAQSTGAVGIGTNSPNNSSSLDLGPSARPLVLPRLTLTEMNAVSSPAQGMIIYNTTEHQLYSYMRYRTALIFGQNPNRWQPVSTGPRMMAWGIVDSFGTEINGSVSYSIAWDATNHWYRFSLPNSHDYYKDSMLLMITAVGNGSWNQAVSTGELIEANGRLASIKFTDISRLVGGFNTLDSRRRSGFHFVLYDLRKDPY